MANTSAEEVHIKNLTDGKLLKIDGKEEFHLIGLGQDGTVQTVPLQSENFTDIPGGIMVPLLKLTKCHHGGLMLTSSNKDFPCFVNKEILTSEINLLGGSIIEVADKRLKVFVGPISRERRLLPHTPGISVSKKPPPKPNRAGENPSVQSEETDWCHVGHAHLDHEELLKQMTSSKQVADLAASFLTKQVNMYTDSKLCTKMTDQIFKFMQEVTEYQQNIIVGYINEVTSYLDEMPESERDKPLHAPAIKLLVELLRQILDPLPHVLLCLELLRKFSHFPQNLPIMIKCQAAAAVMGCMAVYLKEEDIQLNCLDILAKITTYQYKLTEKIQIRETGLEMVLRALNHHVDHEDILQAGCRTLSNLTSTLQIILDSWLDTDYNSDSDVEDGITRYEELLNYIFTHATPTVQKILQNFTENLGIRTEGRRFLYNLSKMTLILTKKGRRCLVVDDENDLEDSSMVNTCENLVKTTVLTSTQKLEETKSILKNPGEKTPIALRKVQFVDEQLVTSVSSSDEDSDLNSSIEFSKQKEAGGAVIEITETRKLTKTEIRNFKLQNRPDFDLLSSLESSTEMDRYQNITEILTVDTKECGLEDSVQSNFSENSTKEDDDISERHNLSNEPVINFNVNIDVHDNEINTKAISDFNNEHIIGITDTNIYNNNSEKLISCKDNVPESEHHIDDTTHCPNSFSVSEVEMLTRIIRSKIVQHVSLLVLNGNDSQALKDIDLSLSTLLEKAEAVPGLVIYVNQQYDHSKTLLDVDTAYLISLVDAVRYSSLLPDLLTKSLLDVTSGLKESMDGFVMFVAASCLKSAFTNKAFNVVTDETLIKAMKTNLQPLAQKSQHIAHILEVLESLPAS